MIDRLNRDLQRAKILCHAGDLLGAYTILKRYYDRFPFKPEPDHTTFISMFVWALCELGRDADIRFYIDQIERRRHQRGDSAETLYSLGVLYAFGKDANLDEAKKLLLSALELVADDVLHARISMSLAFVYQRLHVGNVAVKELIDSIREVEDPYLQIAKECWLGILSYDSNDYVGAERHFKHIDKMILEYPDWYFTFSVTVLRSCMHSKSGDREQGRAWLDRARTMLIGRNYRVSMKQLYAAEEYLRPKEPPTKISIDTESASSVQKLLSAFENQKFLSKKTIVETIYARQYQGEADDKLVYYHVHNLRKFFKQQGLQEDTLKSDPKGYRLTRKLEFIKERL